MFSLWERHLHSIEEGEKEEEEEGKKTPTFHFSITPSSFTSPILLWFPRRGAQTERRDAFQRRAVSPPSHSSAIIPAPTFMHETQRKIESIQRPFRQWRKEILRALLDMKIYNKNQFLHSLCSLNDKASAHSAIVCRESNSAAPAETRAPYTFWPAIADSNMIQTYWDNRRHLISSVEREREEKKSYLISFAR